MSMPIKFSIQQMLLHIQKSWWVFACAIVCFSFYEKSTKPLIMEKMELLKQKATLERKIQQTSSSNYELTILIKHHKDPEIQERLLIQYLGLIPEGYTKICY